MNRLGILAHQATELMGCTEDTVSLAEGASYEGYRVEAEIELIKYLLSETLKT